MWFLGLLVVCAGAFLWTWIPVAGIVVTVIGVLATVVLGVFEHVTEPNETGGSTHGDDGWTHTQYD